MPPIDSCAACCSRCSSQHRSSQLWSCTRYILWTSGCCPRHRRSSSPARRHCTRRSETSIRIATTMLGRGVYRLSGSGLSALASFGAALALGPLLAGPGRKERLLGGLASGYFTLFLLLAGRRWGLVCVVAVAALFLALRYRWLLLVGLGLAAAAIGVVSRVGLTDQCTAARLSLTRFGRRPDLRRAAPGALGQPALLAG